MKYCSNCNEEKTGNMLFCEVCGEKLIDISGGGMQPPLRPQRADNNFLAQGPMNPPVNPQANRPMNPQMNPQMNRPMNPQMNPQMNRPMAQPVNQPVKSGKKKTGMIVAIVAAVLGVLLIAGTVVGIIIYRNSDGYKLKNAEELLISGELEEAQLVLDDMYDDRAIALKRFAALENAKNSLVDSLQNDSAYEASQTASNFFELINDYRSADWEDLIPETLHGRVRYYAAAANYFYNTFLPEETSGELSSILNNCQGIMMNDIERWNSSRNGNTFRLSSQIARMNTAKDALENLEDLSFTETLLFDLNLTSVPVTNDDLLLYQQDYFGQEMLDNGISFSTELNTIISELYSSCTDKVDWYESFLDDALEKWDAEDDLYSTSPRPGDVTYVAADLDRVASWDDIDNNVSTIMNLFNRDILYNLFVGSAP